MPAEIPEDVLRKEGFTDEILAGATIMKAVGCDACADGYKGRVGIYEVVRITPVIADLIMAEGNSLEISRQARTEGFHDCAPLHSENVPRVSLALRRSTA
jgi:type IV pilus assembly protein PilB